MRRSGLLVAVSAGDEATTAARAGDLYADAGAADPGSHPFNVGVTHQ
jgi:hypothetical protein